MAADAARLRRLQGRRRWHARLSQLRRHPLRLQREDADDAAAERCSSPSPPPTPTTPAASSSTSTAAFALGATLDYEEVQQYTLLIKADDQGSRHPGVDLPLQHAALLTVDVLDVNERPRALQSRRALEIDEDVAPRTEAGCARVHDDEVNRTGAIAPTQTLRYALVVPSDVWTLEASNGCLYSRADAPVDAEDSRFGATYNASSRQTRHAVHELTFTATDSDPTAPLTSEAAVIELRVRDVADAAVDSVVAAKGARSGLLPTTGIDASDGAKATIILRGRDLGPTDGSGEFVVRYQCPPRRRGERFEPH